MVLPIQNIDIFSTSETHIQAYLILYKNKVIVPNTIA